MSSWSFIKGVADSVEMYSKVHCRALDQNTDCDDGIKRQSLLSCYSLSLEREIG